MEWNVLISIIVPVYNVDKYLRKCLDSIISQTYSLLEIIVVDDGSLDTSGEIAEEYAKHDKRIRVIHKANGGLSSARNAGLDISNGDYIMFIDSDDYVDKDICKIMLSKAINNDCQMVECGMVKVYRKKEVRETKRQELLLSGREMTLEYLKGNSLLQTSACDSLYHRSIFDGVRFDEGRLHEDKWFKYKAFFRANRVCVLKESLYFYIQSREGSIMTVTIKEKNVRDVLDALESRWHYFELNHDEELVEMAKATYMRELLSYYYVVNGRLQDEAGKDRLSEEIVNQLNENKEYILRSEYLAGSKIKYFLFYNIRLLTTLVSNIRFKYFS